MFKCVFIPASVDPVQELSKSKSGGLENDQLRKSAEEYFNRTKVQVNAAQSTEQITDMLRKQGLDPSTMDKDLIAQLGSLGGGPCEIVSLYLPTKDNGYESVSMYCDSNGQSKSLPVNTRATSLANCCGHNTTIYGDAFIGRCFDDESKPWERKDFTVADMNSDAPWVINARKKNQGKNMNSYSTSGTMQNFLKQQTSSSVGSEEVKPVPAPEKEEDIIKKEANNLFIAKNYAAAEELYTKAIAIAGKESLAVLYTNRSAARANLDRNAEALEDADTAIRHDPTWLKAYHRRSSALEKLERHREAYETWVEAGKHCQGDKMLVKMVAQARLQWTKIFRNTAVAPLLGDDDLVARFCLLTDKRERLSTLAHLWNDSTREDRHKYFQVFLSLISGDGKVNPAAEVFTVDFMVDMPMDNYLDLPRHQVAGWCDYVQAVTSERRLALFQQMWYKLSSEEHNDVIQDFKMLMSEGLAERDEAEKAARAAAAAGAKGGGSSNSNGGSSAGDDTAN